MTGALGAVLRAPMSMISAPSSAHRWAVLNTDSGGTKDLEKNDSGLVLMTAISRTGAFLPTVIFPILQVSINGFSQL
jgi:hypothetical protein